MSVLIRPARREDGPAFVRLVCELAAFEKLAPPDAAAQARLIEHAFASPPHPPRFEVLLGEVDGALAGYAIFFPTYSSFRARPSLYLEDLYVQPDARRRGLGRAFMTTLAGIARDRGCGRFEWIVLDWNERAQRFYEQLGARVLTDWRVCRLEDDALAALANAGPSR